MDKQLRVDIQQAAFALGLTDGPVWGLIKDCGPHACLAAMDSTAKRVAADPRLGARAVFRQEARRQRLSTARDRQAQAQHVWLEEAAADRVQAEARGFRPDNSHIRAALDKLREEGGITEEEHRTGVKGLSFVFEVLEGAKEDESDRTRDETQVRA